jgi:hypothetical protein
MKDLKSIFALSVITALCCCLTQGALGQFNEKQNKKKSRGISRDFWSIYNTSYQVGIHALDDDDTPFEHLLDTRRWSWLPLPTKFTVIKELKNDLKIDGSLYVTKLKKNLPKNKYVSPFLYFGLDVNLRYQIELFKSDPNRVYYTKRKHYIDTDFRKKMRDMSLTVYPLLGVGFHYRTQRVYLTNFSINIGGGIDWWLVEDKYALNFQSIAKFGFRVPLIDTNSNILHHSIGFVYFYEKRFSLKKKKIKYDGF